MKVIMNIKCLPVLFGILVAGMCGGYSQSISAQEPCPLPDVTPALADIVVLLLDTNHDGQLSLAEIRIVYPEMDSMMFMMVDLNNNGRLSAREVVNVVNLLGVDVLGYVDSNGDGLIQYEETSDYLTPEMFLHFDINRNNVIDCEDYAYFMVPPAYGEGEDDCGSAEMLYFLAHAAMLFLDADADGVIVYDEIGPLVGPEYGPLVFNVLDRDGSADVTEEEVLALLLDLPFDIIRIIDLDQNGAITPDDLDGLLTPEMLSIMDYNGDGMLYCDDLAMLPIDEDWGVLPFLTDEMVSDRLLAVLRRMFRLLDSDNDNALSYEEIRSRVALPQRLFLALDVNEDEFVTWEELDYWATYLAELSQTMVIDFSREIVGPIPGNFFQPGVPLLVRLTANKYGMDSITHFAITEMLPEGWSVGAVHNKGIAQLSQESVPGATKVVISWAEDAPLFPLELSYELIPPMEASGMVSILGQASFGLVGGARHSGGMVPTVLMELLHQAYAHSADTDGDWRISLSELLRVIQLYNSAAYHLNPATEDGFDVGEGLTNGPGHSADYLNDWRITLPELLRVIQLYNAPSSNYCIGGATEDGYMPAPF